MVVFNLWAIPVVIVIGIIYGILAWLAPDFMEGPYGDLTICVVAFFIGGIADLIGAKARLFWLPVWLIAVLAGGYQSWELWGWLGVVGGVLALVLAVMLLFGWSYRATQKEWEEAPQNLLRARQAFAAGDAETGWPLLTAAFHLPFWGSFDRAVCAHDLQVLEILEPLVSDFLDDGDRERYAALKQSFAAGKLSEEKVDVESDETTWVQALLANRGAPEPAES